MSAAVYDGVENGRFGAYGGRFVPEILVPALEELEDAYSKAKVDKGFNDELRGLLRHYVGRPTPLHHAERLGKACGGARIWLKREDLCHTGSHKLNNALAQVLLAKRMGKTRVIAETGAGQHGVATATAAAVFGMGCTVFMGRCDVGRQALNVHRMGMLGAEVVPVDSGSRTLKDACNEALRYWASHPCDTHYVIGSVVGPHPYPAMVGDFQSIIGEEARGQVLEATGRLPHSVVACVGGGSNAIGFFRGFMEDPGVRLVGVEAGGLGLGTCKHAASLSKGTPGVLHGSYSPLLQDGNGQVMEAHSVSAGLDYPGVGPEHAWLRDSGRAEYQSATDREALWGFGLLCRTEGIIPALESSHAIAYAARLAGTLAPDRDVIVCLSGRGDKDVAQVAVMEGVGC